MAVFFLNDCRFQGCGMRFSTLGDLIQHIEDTHIDSDPQVLEKQEIQQPAALALSYIQRCFTDDGRKEHQDFSKKLKERDQSPASTMRSVTPSGSEFDDFDSNSEDEDSDVPMTPQEFSAELILSMVNGQESPADPEKPVECPVPGCTKRYKNINGMKYHAHHAHKKEFSQIKKTYNCTYCSKNYKTTNGLRNHMLNHHTPADVVAMKPALTSSVFISSQKSFAKHLDKSNSECSASAILSESADSSFDISFAVDNMVMASSDFSQSKMTSPVAVKRLTLPKIIRAGFSIPNCKVATAKPCKDIMKQKRKQEPVSVDMPPFMIQEEDVAMAMSPEISIDL